MVSKNRSQHLKFAYTPKEYFSLIQDDQTAKDQFFVKSTSKMVLMNPMDDSKYDKNSGIIKSEPIPALNVCE